MLKAFPGNPAHDCVFNPPLKTVYEKHENKTPPFGIRIAPHLANLSIDLETIKSVTPLKVPPWKLLKPEFNFDLRKHTC